MKKLLYTLVILVTVSFMACNNEPDKPMQDYTSFTLTWIGGGSHYFSNFKTGFFDENGRCILLFEHEQFVEGVETEVFIMSEFVSPIYLFYKNGAVHLRFEASFEIQENRLNRIIVPDRDNTRGIHIHPVTIYNWPH